ncbi:MAG: hypothetical protein AAFX06_08745 [Planctomycetota bacterium]
MSAIKKHNRRGLALLMVVACILVITVALVKISRESLLIAIETADAVDSVTLRWEQASLQLAATRCATEAFGGQVAAFPTPMGPIRSYELDVTLNNRAYRLLLADESAKLHLQTLARLDEGTSAASLLTTVTAGKLRGRLDSPVNVDSGTIRGWGDVVSIGSGQSRGVRVEDLPVLTTDVTVWGDGKINVDRTPDPLLFEMSRLILPDSESREWIENYRSAIPRKSLTTVLDELTIEEEERRKLRRVLTSQSSCVSAWIIRRGFPDAGHSVSISVRGGASLWETKTTYFDW